MDFIKKAEEIVSQEEISLYSEFDNSLITKIKPTASFEIKFTICDGQPEIARLYANNELIESYDSENKTSLSINGLEMACNTINNILEGIGSGAIYIKVKAN